MNANTPGINIPPNADQKPTSEQPSAVVQGCPDISVFRERDVVTITSTATSHAPSKVSSNGGGKGSGTSTKKITNSGSGRTLRKTRKPKNNQKRIVLKNYLPK